MTVDTPKRPKEVGHDETPALIVDHPFVPRAEWWSLCKICGLAQAAHAATSVRPPFEYYGDDDPDD